MNTTQLKWISTFTEGELKLPDEDETRKVETWGMSGQNEEFLLFADYNAKRVKSFSTSTKILKLMFVETAVDWWVSSCVMLGQDLVVAEVGKWDDQRKVRNTRVVLARVAADGMYHQSKRVPLSDTSEVSALTDFLLLEWVQIRESLEWKTNARIPPVKVVVSLQIPILSQIGRILLYPCSNIHFRILLILAHEHRQK